MTSPSKSSPPSSQTQIENAMLSLYNFYSNPSTSKCTPHSSKAIYFCSDPQCTISYICSECLIEMPDHFAKHYKHLIPIDDIKKFFKFIKFPVDQLISSLSSQITITPIDTYYDTIKNLFLSIVDTHYKTHSSFLKETITEQTKLLNEPKENITIIENKINTFIKEGKRNGIQELIKNIDSFMKSKEKENVIKGSNEINIELITNEVKGIINKNIENVYGVKLNEEGMMMSPIRGRKSPQKQKSPNVIDKQSIEEQFNEIDRNSVMSGKIKEIMENENSFNSPNRSGVKRKELEIIQEEVIEHITTETETNETNETPLSTLTHTQINLNFNNEDNHQLQNEIKNISSNNNNNNSQHSESIKSRLEFLKSKIENLKSYNTQSSSS